MTWLAAFGVAVMAAWTALADDPLPEPPMPVIGVTDIAPGHGWPADPGTILGAVYAADQVHVRRHAWRLWGGVTAPAEPGHAALPVWETWYDTSEVFGDASDLATTARPVRRRMEPPAQSIHRMQAIGGDAAAIMAFVKLNRSAAAFIRASGYHRAATLDDLNRDHDRRETPLEERSLAPFPREAVLLKAVFWLVKDGRSPTSEDGLTAFPVWDPGYPPPENGQTPTHLTWRRCVAIDPDRRHAGRRTARVTCNGVADTPAEVVGLDRFYAFRLATAQQVADAAHFMTVLSGSGGEQERFVTNRGQTPELGDHVVLAAIHLTTKEIDDWTFQTFWWSPTPDQPPFGDDRPAAIGAPWDSYAMCAAYSMVTPRRPDGGPHVCFNPYLETDLGPTRPYVVDGASYPADPMAGTRSNCMNCHRHAAWHADPPPNPQGTGLVNPDDPFFAGKVKTDFMWSLVFHAHPVALR